MAKPCLKGCAISSILWMLDQAHTFDGAGNFYRAVFGAVVHHDEFQIIYTYFGEIISHSKYTMGYFGNAIFFIISGYYYR